MYPPAAYISSDASSNEEDANNSSGDIMKPTTDQLEIAYYDDSDEEGNNLLLAEAATAGNKEDGDDGDDKIEDKTRKNTLKIAASEFIRSPPSQNPRLLVCGESGSGQAHIAPALLHALEQFAVHAISLPALIGWR